MSDEWLLLYSYMQRCATAAHIVGALERERAFLDTLHMMDQIEAAK